MEPIRTDLGRMVYTAARLRLLLLAVGVGWVLLACVVVALVWVVLTLGQLAQGPATPAPFPSPLP